MAIDKNIVQISDDLIIYTQNAYSSVPALVLDKTWPSVGALDMIMSDYRYGYLQEDKLEQVLYLPISYISCLVHDLWQLIADEVEVSIEKGIGVVAKARGGKFLPEGTEFKVPISKVIRHALRVKPNEKLPIFSNFSREDNINDSNILSNIAIGLFTGICPYGVGPWKNANLDDELVQEQIDIIVTELAKQSAAFYARVFPEEKIGQMPEVYLGGLIYPPPTMGGLFPATLAGNFFYNLMNEYNFSSSDIKQFGENLARIPDENFCLNGIALNTGLTISKVDKNVLAAARYGSPLVSLLRPAIYSIKDFFKGRVDWLITDEPLDDQDIRNYRNEITAGINRFSVYSANYLENPNVKDLLAALSIYGYDEAQKISEALCKAEPNHPEHTIQLIKIYLLQNKLDQAKKLVDENKEKPEFNTHFAFIELESDVLALSGDAKTAVDKLLDAFNAAPDESPRKNEILEKLAIGLIMLGEDETADQVLAEFDPSEGRYCPIQITGLIRRQEFDKAMDLADEILQNCPSSRQLFLYCGPLVAEKNGRKNMPSTETPPSVQ